MPHLDMLSLTMELFLVSARTTQRKEKEFVLPPIGLELIFNSVMEVLSAKALQICLKSFVDSLLFERFNWEIVQSAERIRVAIRGVIPYEAIAR